jgi:MOSC domain-containing protein YiiM
MSASRGAAAAVDSPSLHELLRRFPHSGRVEALLLRPGRGLAALSVAQALFVEGAGIEGDRSAARASARPGGHKRQVTLIQAEHLPSIAAWSGRAALDAAELRRNVVVSGLNLLSARSPLAGVAFALHLGDEVVLDVTGPCDPCSKMEAVLGAGGYSAMRGHGGVTARVLHGGRVAVGDRVWVTTAGSA